MIVTSREIYKHNLILTASDIDPTTTATTTTTTTSTTTTSHIAYDGLVCPGNHIEGFLEEGGKWMHIDMAYPSHIGPRATGECNDD